MHRTDGALLPKQKATDAAMNSFKERREPLSFSTKWSKVKVTNATSYFSNHFREFSWFITPKGEFRNINLAWAPKPEPQLRG